MASNTLYENGAGSNGLVRQILVGIVTASVIGVWAFASTRASSADVEQMEVELKAADAALIMEIKELRSYLHNLDVEQSEFRAQVREALSIK